MPPDESREAQYARLDERMKNVEALCQHIDAKLDGSYVTRTEFTPVKNLVYGCAGIMLIGVVGALVALVVRS